MNSKISLIIPVYNESGEIENFFNDIKKCNFNLINEIIFVDDCSIDNSLNLLKEKINEFNNLLTNVNFLLINNQKNRGYGFSIKKGVDISGEMEEISILKEDILKLLK